MREAIYTHPSNLGVLGTIQVGHDISFPFSSPTGGLPVYVDKNLPATQPTGKVKFPTDGNWKFCEFEEKDEGWTLALGIATREEEPVYYIIDQSKLKVNWDTIIKLDWCMDDKMKEHIEQMQDRITRDIYTKTLSSSYIGAL